MELNVVEVALPIGSTVRYGSPWPSYMVTFAGGP